MAQTVSLSASPRQATGKGAARQARFRGRVPAVIYGHGRDTQPLELEAKALEKALQGVEPASTIIDLDVDGKTVKTLIREVEIEVLPANIPDRVELDVNALKIGDSLHVRDLTIPNAKILTEADLTIATVVPPRAEEVAAPTPEAATEVAEAAAEGGAPAKPEAKGGAAPAKTEKTEKPKGGKES